MYYKDVWNIADIIVIILTIAFTILDMLIIDKQLSGVFRIRGIFRLLRISLLYRKLDTMRKKNEAKKKLKSISDGIESPVEAVLKILSKFRD